MSRTCWHQPSLVNLTLEENSKGLSWAQSSASNSICLELKNTALFALYVLLLFYMIERAYLIGQLVNNLPAMQKTLVQFLSWEDCWRRDRLHTSVFWGFLYGSAGKESTCNVGDLSLIPGLRSSPGEGKGYPFQYSALENSTDYIVKVMLDFHCFIFKIHSSKKVS